MFCPECGYKNVEGAAFCENCGTKLTGMPGSINQKETSYEKTGEKTTKKSVPFGKINKMLLIEIPIAMISLLIFIMVFQAKFSVKSVVERYVEGMGDGNWNQVYDTLYLNDSGDFMSKQAFVTSQTINGIKWDEDLEVQKIRKKTSNTYRVKYEGDNGVQRIDVKVKRRGLTWKVDEADTFLSKNFSDIETTSAVLESYDEPTVMTAGYSKATVEQMADQAVKDLNNIFQEAAANKRFSDLDILNNMYADEKDSAIRKYESARDDYFENENNSWEFLNYTITNCEAQAQMITRDQKQLIEVTIKGDAQWEKNYVYYDGDKERETETEDAEHTLYYIDDGGTWKLYDLDLWTW